MRNRTRGGLSVRGGDTGDGLSGVAVGDDVAVGAGGVLGGVGGVGVGGEGVGVGVGVGVKLGGGGGVGDAGDTTGEAVGGGSGDGGGPSLSSAATAIAMTIATIVAVTIVALIILRRRRARSAATEDLLDPALAERDPAPDLADNPGEDHHRDDDREVAPRIGNRCLHLLPRIPPYGNGGSP